MPLCEFLNKFLVWQIINLNAEKQTIMRGCLSYVISIAAIALLICIVCWMFATDFIIFDILLMLGLIALHVVVALVIIVIVIWVIKELFG